MELKLEQIEVVNSVAKWKGLPENELVLSKAYRTRVLKTKIEECGGKNIKPMLNKLLGKYVQATALQVGDEIIYLVVLYSFN